MYENYITDNVHQVVICMNYQIIKTKSKMNIKIMVNILEHQTKMKN
jgi:hypothetical protein